jgi:hypothetical protein
VFFIYGWGRRSTDDLGPTLPVVCRHCSNAVWFRLVTTRKWFSLSFIPIIPYDRETLLVCPICSQGLSLQGAQAEKAHQLNGLAKSFLTGTMSETEYVSAGLRLRLLPSYENVRSDLASVGEPRLPTTAVDGPRSSGPVPVIKIVIVASIFLTAIVIFLWTSSAP